MEESTYLHDEGGGDNGTDPQFHQCPYAKQKMVRWMGQVTPQGLPLLEAMMTLSQ